MVHLASMIRYWNDVAAIELSVRALQRFASEPKRLLNDRRVEPGTRAQQLFDDFPYARQQPALLRLDQDAEATLHPLG
jgi:hypothetical protein